MLMIGKLERPPWALFPILFLTSLGCPGPTAPSPPTKPFQGVVLTVAVVDEPGLVGLVGAQRGEWMGSRDAVVQVREQPLSSPLDLRDIDVVLFPGDRMGDIIDTAGLVELPEEIVSPKSSNDSPTQDSMAFQEVFPAIRDQAIRQGRDRLALPIGGSVLVLVYRRDLLERPDVVKAAEEAGLKLTPPETWEELDALAKTLTCRDWDDDGQADGRLVEERRVGPRLVRHGVIDVGDLHDRGVTPSPGGAISGASHRHHGYRTPRDPSK